MMGCDHGNPSLRSRTSTCRKPRIVHPDWGIDLLSTVRTTRDPRQPVYAMGAGVVHYGASGQGCGGSRSTRGNYLWIDHGDGVYSYYGHLSSFTVKNGQYVSARTRIGTIGNSGNDRCRQDPTLRYLFIQVSRGGKKGRFVPVSTMYACVGGRKVAWPQHLRGNTGGRWKTWNDVPRGQLLPAPSSGRSCMATPPATPDRPTGVRLRHSAHRALTASWHLAPSGRAASGVGVVLQAWHPTAHAWWDERSIRIRPGVHSVRFTKLHQPRTYRLRVYAGNRIGWSAPGTAGSRRI